MPTKSSLEKPQTDVAESKTMIELGSVVKDSATGLKGMVTHMLIELNQVRHYLFQPRGLNPETGVPVESIWAVPERLVGGKMVEEPNLPLEVVGTQVTDMASGFTGTAISLILHIDGCVHVTVQPKGRFQKTGGAAERFEFNIRRLKGKAIKMNRQERVKDREENPGPSSTPPFMASKPKF